MAEMGTSNRLSRSQSSRDEAAARISWWAATNTAEAESLAMSGNAPGKIRAPREPKPVKDAVKQAVREAEHKRKRQEYDESKTQHQEAMVQRKKEQEARWRAENAAPAAVSKRNASSSAAQPRVSRPRVGTTRPRVPQFVPASPADDDAVRDETGRHPRWAAWAADVERIAARCGADEAQILYAKGLWYEPPNDEDVMDAYKPPEYVASDRALQLERLEGVGVPPTAEEKAALPWPHREWWEDRDRIVLLCEFIRYMDTIPPPGGWQNDVPTRQDGGWLEQVEGHAGRLWNGTQVGGDSVRADDHWGSPRAICAGYRYLTSLPSCPQSMRLPMHLELFARRDM